MQTGWFRGRLAGKLAGKTRLSWTIAKASWSPWGGGCLGGLTAKAVYSGEGTLAPIFEIDEIRVRPYWGALLGGRLEFREIRVKSPRGKVPVELLAQLMQGDGRVDVARMTVPKQTPEEENGPRKRPGEEQPGEEPKEKPDQSGDRQASHGKKKPGEGAEPPPSSPPASVRREKPGHLVVEDGELHVYTMSHREQPFVVAGIAGEMPFAGEDAAGWFETSGVRYGDHGLVGALRIPVAWQKPVLRLSPVEMRWNGLRVRALAALRVRGRVTGSVEIRGLPGPLKPVNLPGWPAVGISAEEVELLARWQGELTRPASWVGNLVAVGSELRGHHADRGEALVFGKGQVVVDLRGGVVQVADARLMGERLSVMGNGLGLMDGRAAAVVRVVADPEYSGKMTEVAIGSFLSAGWTSSWLAPMETPDRYYRDIHLQGGFPTYVVDIGRNREQLDVRRAWQLAVAFVKREQREESEGGLLYPGIGWAGGAQNGRVDDPVGGEGAP